MKDRFLFPIYANILLCRASQRPTVLCPTADPRCSQRRQSPCPPEMPRNSDNRLTGERVTNPSPKEYAAGASCETFLWNSAPPTPATASPWLLYLEHCVRIQMGPSDAAKTSQEDSGSQGLLMTISGILHLELSSSVCLKPRNPGHLKMFFWPNQASFIF